MGPPSCLPLPAAALLCCPQLPGTEPRLPLSLCPPAPFPLPPAPAPPPQHANSIGITFGGQVMRWMEQCAFIAASRVARGGFLLTAAMDSISFLNPARVGDTVYVESQVRRGGPGAVPLGCLATSASA